MIRLQACASPDQGEWNDLNFRMFQFRWGGCEWHDPAYQAMLYRRWVLEWRIYRWKHAFAEFKTSYARPRFVK